MLQPVFYIILKYRLQVLLKEIRSFDAKEGTLVVYKRIKKCFSQRVADISGQAISNWTGS